MGRVCGDCTACCFTGGVPEILKPAHSICPHLKEGVGCSLYGKEARPKICNSFRCAWLEGCGSNAARPDKSGMLLSVNRTPGGVIGMAIELYPRAIHEEGRWPLVDFAKTTMLPVITVAFESKPPNDKGDYVVVADELIEKCSEIIDHTTREELGEGVSLFKRVDPWQPSP